MRTSEHYVPEKKALDSQLDVPYISRIAHFIEVSDMSWFVHVGFRINKISSLRILSQQVGDNETEFIYEGMKVVLQLRIQF